MSVFKQKYYEFVLKKKYQEIWQKSTFHQKTTKSGHLMSVKSGEKIGKEMIFPFFD